jgi:hypothetical protein
MHPWQSRIILRSVRRSTCRRTISSAIWESLASALRGNGSAFPDRLYSQHEQFLYLTQGEAQPFRILYKSQPVNHVVRVVSIAGYHAARPTYQAFALVEAQGIDADPGPAR